MKVATAIVLSLLLATTALAQGAAISVTAMTPAEGPARGGTGVVLLGTGFETTIQCVVPCPTKVLFDKTEVIPGETSDTRMVVVTPPHAAGKVDVTIRTGDGRSLTLPGAFTYLAAADAAFTPILLPVYTDGQVAGANGSKWQTDLWLHNSGSAPLELAPWDCPPGQACPAVFPLRHTLAPGASQHNLPAFFKAPTPNVSRLVWVTRELADRLAIQLRIADVSRSTLNAGTELPAVRERDLLVTPADLLNVPFGGPFRVMLRLYDVHNTTAKFRVTLFDQSGAMPGPLTVIDVDAATSETGDFRSQAAYGQLSFDVLGEVNRPWPSAFRVRIEPLTTGSRWFALASVTNNDTQLVTTVTPR